MTLGDGNNIITNSGSITSLQTGSGNDKVTNTGAINNMILGAGDDIYTGSGKAELVKDGAGADQISFGGGNDYYEATGGGGSLTDLNDIIDGGAGTDLYNAAAAVDGIYINIDAIAHEDFGKFSSVQKQTAFGNDIHNDTVKGFENVITGGGADIVYGSAAANYLVTGGGADQIHGYAGNDDDRIIGGLGADELWGGAGSDRFTKTRDVIRDFDSADFIDLSGIDADTKAPGDQAFVYLNAIGGKNSDTAPGAMFTKEAGQLRTVCGWLCSRRGRQRRRQG